MGCPEGQWAFLCHAESHAREKVGWVAVDTIAGADDAGAEGFRVGAADETFGFGFGVGVFWFMSVSLGLYGLIC